MLEIRPSCENCNLSLPNDCKEAMICTFECTFCKGCVNTILNNVCPNCGGGFTNRPTRPKHLLDKYPFRTKVVHKPIDIETFTTLLDRYKDVDVRKR